MTNTNTNTTQAAALAVRDAAAALARRSPLYYGSGEPADEELAQAIEDLPLPDVDVTDWQAEAERLRGLLRHEQQERHAVLDRLDAAILARTASQAQAEQYMAERNAAQLQAQREAGEMARKLREERDELSEQVAFTARHLAIISGVLGSPEPIEIDDIAARLHLLIAERNALAARLAEIERAADLNADIKAQRAVVQQLASRPVCNWAGQCRHQRQATADAPELAEPADPRTPPPGCRLLGDYEPAQAGDMAYIGAIGGRWRRVRPRMGIIGATMD